MPRVVETASPVSPRAASLLLAAGFAFQALYLASYLRGPLSSIPLADAAVYDRWAREILAGELTRSRPFHMAPLYAYLLAGVYAVTGAKLAGLAVIQSVLWLANGSMVFALSRRLRPGSELWAGLLYLLHAPFAFYAVRAETATVAVAGVLATLLLLSGGRPAAAGLAAGLTCLARPELLLFVPLAVVWIRLQEGRRGLRAPLLFALLATLGILPATLHNLAAGEAIPISWSGGEVFAQGSLRGGTGRIQRPPELSGDPSRQEEESLRAASRALGHRASAREAQAYWLRLGLREIAADPLGWCRLEIRKLLLVFSGRDLPLSYSIDLERRLASPALGLLPVSGPLLLGLALLAPAATRRSRVGSLLLLFLASQLAALLLFFVATRLRLPLVAALVPLSAAGAAALLEAEVTRARRLLAAGAMGLLLVHDLRLRVSLAEPTSNLASALSSAGDVQAAEATYREALSQNPSNARIWFNLGTLLEVQTRPEARDAFRRALELDPRLLEAANSLASSLLRQGELRESEELLRKALSQRPDYALARFNLALILSRTGRAREALAEAERALALEPDASGTDPRGPGHLLAGDLAASLGDPSAACAHYRAAARLLPRPDAARARLERSGCPDREPPIAAPPRP